MWLKGFSYNKPAHWVLNLNCHFLNIYTLFGLFSNLLVASFSGFSFISFNLFWYKLFGSLILLCFCFCFLVILCFFVCTLVPRVIYFFFTQVFLYAVNTPPPIYVDLVIRSFRLRGLILRDSFFFISIIGSYSL